MRVAQTRIINWAGGLFSRNSTLAALSWIMQHVCLTICDQGKAYCSLPLPSRVPFVDQNTPTTSRGSDFGMVTPSMLTATLGWWPTLPLWIAHSGSFLVSAIV